MEYKLFAGQYFMLTLKVTERFFRELAQDRALAAKISDPDYVGALGAESVCEDFSFVKNPFSIGLPETSSGRFSYEKISKFLNISHTTVENYIDMYKNVSAKIRESVKDSLVPDNFDELQQNLKDEIHTAVEKAVRGRLSQKVSMKVSMSGAKGGMLTDDMRQIVSYATERSGLFDNRLHLYLLFFHWHDAGGVIAGKRGALASAYPAAAKLLETSFKLRSLRANFDYVETKNLLDEYFGMFGEFLRVTESGNLLEYTIADCAAWLESPNIGRRLVLELCRVFCAFYSFAPHPKDVDLHLESALPTGSKHSAPLYEYPQIKGNDGEGDIDSSFKFAFGEIISKDEKAESVMSTIGADDTGRYPAGEGLFDEAKALLREATPMSGGGAYVGNVRHYEGVADGFATPEGMSRPIPYLPILDAAPGRPYGFGDFIFAADRTCLPPPLDLGPFGGLGLLESLEDGAVTRAKRAGRDGVSERKIFIHDSVIDPENPPFTMNVGKIPYFDAVARRDFFLSLMPPTDANVEKALRLLLKHKRLSAQAGGAEDTLVRGDEYADILQRACLDENGAFSAARMAAALCHEPHSLLIQHMKTKIRAKLNELYRKNVIGNTVRRGDGKYEILNMGTTYAGCGTFVLTTEMGEDGVDRPFLLVEKRWKVSEESGNLCYPSAGSCDFYDPKVYRPSVEKYKDFRAEDTWRHPDQHEANPFMTAARELWEELQIYVKPTSLHFLSFGMDLNRNLQQFSFYLKSELSAPDILKDAQDAVDGDEGKTFMLPFKRDTLTAMLNAYQLEPGAVWSLGKLMEIREDLLWK